MQRCISTILFLILFSFNLQAQAPLKFNYQGVARDISGTVLADQDISLYLSIVPDDLTGASVYEEIQFVTTNSFGLFNVQVGDGTVVLGSISGIDWGTGVYLLKVEMDPLGGTTDFEFLGASQLVSVPYALYAETSGSSGATGPTGPAGPAGPTGPTGPTGAFSLLEDADSDTKIQVEESADEDMIRFDLEGTEQWVMKGARMENMNSGRSVFIGLNAGRDDDLVGNWNVAIGHNAFVNNTSGQRNVAVGYGSMNLNTEGYGNSAFGRGALADNTTGSGNVAVGIAALASSIEESQLVAIGDSALFSNITGIWNTAIGSRALKANTYGNTNTAIGYESGLTNETGGSNVAVGFRSLKSNVSGDGNTAIGYKALEDNTSLHRNSAVGYLALANSTGEANTALGSSALQWNTTGGFNTSIGAWSLFNSSSSSPTIGSRNTAVGYGASSTAANFDNTTALGYNAEPTASNMVRIGDASVSSIGGFANWTNVSDGRFKTNVEEQVPGLDFVLNLRPVTYHLNMNALAEFYNLPDSARSAEAENLKASELQVGFIAQEVEAAAQEIMFDFHGVEKPANEQSHYGLRYAEFVPSLVKAVQELHQENESLRAKLAKTDKQLMQLTEKIASGKLDE